MCPEALPSMMKKEPMPTAEASPYKSAAEALATLRKMFRLACRCYQERVEMEIIRVHEQVVTAGLAAASDETRKTAGAASGRPKATAANGSGQHAARSAALRAAFPNSEIPDLRDMLTLLRTLEVKPEAGRRKDLKKIESLVEELRLLSERWG